MTPTTMAAAAVANDNDDGEKGEKKNREDSKDISCTLIVESFILFPSA